MSEGAIVPDQDREKIHAIVANLKREYRERLDVIVRDYHAAQKSLNRASHEITRLERHLERVDDFCKQNNVRLETA